MNNYSQYSFDGLGRNSKIVETVSGSVTSTKQFVWSTDKNRFYASCEERDGAGALTKQFFSMGQKNSSSKYFYATDKLGSVREMTDISGVVQAEYAFDPYGRSTSLLENVTPDFKYAGYYAHVRSQLNFTKFRAYSSSNGRWLSRDPLLSPGFRLQQMNDPTINSRRSYESVYLPEESTQTIVRVASMNKDNLFSYVVNNPVNFMDPLGLRDRCPEGPPPNDDWDWGAWAWCSAFCAIFKGDAWVECMMDCLNPSPRKSNCDPCNSKE